ncbi:arginine--tRNA ligase [soil metagenome]
MIRDVLADALRAALGSVGVDPVPGEVHLERPARREHGDWSSNVALATAKGAGRRPRELAAELVAALEADPPPHVRSVEVAGPGFVNFRLHDSWLHEVLGDVVAAGEDGYARLDLGRGERVQLEFVSVNPTGPLHVGNGWWCAYGDALARVMARCGHDVAREYYVNDTGGQIRNLGESLLARRRGEEVAEGGYQGAYVTELAERYDGPGEVEAAGRWAAEQNLANIRDTLASLGIVFDEWFSQASIEDSEAVEATVELLRQGGLIFERDGALWLRTAELGDPREERVLRKSDGDYTYLAGDLAYHRNKFLLRRFDRVINVWGADHHGQVASLQAGVRALGVEEGRLEVKLGQMISLAGGRMSKRAGNAVALSELIDDIGADATRFLSLQSSLDQATTVDLDVVKQQSMENPVFYVQYAHARIASIAKKAAEAGVSRVDIGGADLSLLVHDRELDVLRTLSTLPDVVASACIERAPHKIATWVRELAGAFHGFYHDCYVLGDDVAPALTQARLWLVEAARTGLVIGLDLLGVSAPESM